MNISLKADLLTLGYSQACEYEDFHEVTPSAIFSRDDGRLFMIIGLTREEFRALAGAPFSGVTIDIGSAG